MNWKLLILTIPVLALLVIPACDKPSDANNEPAPTRAESIPDDAVKYSPETDVFPPVLNDDGWDEPVPMPGPVNTAGAEDSPFMLGDGSTFFFFFTPDVSVPPEQQLLDRVTGIWWTRKSGGSWLEPERILLSDDLSLDGCPFAVSDSLWFCSARVGGYRPIDFYIAVLTDGGWGTVVNAGRRLNQEIEIGELHISNSGEIYFGSDAYDGYGGMDIFKIAFVDGDWSEPVNLGDSVNSEYDDFLPFVSSDGNELWFTRPGATGYPGPAVFRSSRINDSVWTAAEEIISCFAGEPTLDDEGNIYFVHHFYSENMQMLEADIYVAYRR